MYKYFLLGLIFVVGCTNRDINSRRVIEKDLSSLKYSVNLDQLEISWDSLELDSEYSVEILRKQKRDKKYRKVKELNIKDNIYKTKIPEFIELSYLIRLKNKDGRLSKGIVLEGIIGKHKEV